MFLPLQSCLFVNIVRTTWHIDKLLEQILWQYSLDTIYEFKLLLKYTDSSHFSDFVNIPYSQTNLKTKMRQFEKKEPVARKVENKKQANYRILVEYLQRYLREFFEI